MATPLPDLVLYSRPGCHLCEDARVALDGLLSERTSAGLEALTLVERNIDDDPDLQNRYAFTIPVVAFAERELELATSRAKLRRFLADALNGDAPASQEARR